jgi:DNA modification methylase
MKLILGDCLDVMKTLPDKSVDVIITDPPYGTTKCKWDIIIPFDSLWWELGRVIKPTGAILVFGQEPFSSKLRISNIDNFRYDWYWEKDKGANFLFGNKMPLKTVEIISVFYQKQPTYHSQKTTNPRGVSKRHLSPNPSKISGNVREIMGESWKETEMDDTQNYHGKNYEPDKLLAKQLIYFAREQRGKVHPTQKPVALIEYLIRTYTDKDESVLDFAMGSGTTGVACAKTGRHFIGIEIDPGYFKIAERRIHDAQQQPALEMQL